MKEIGTSSPIRVTQEALDEFKAIYFKKCGKKLSDDKARSQATKLLRLMSVIYRPIKNELTHEDKNK